MVGKNRGISVELLIHPGETIADLLEERGITQKELAQRAGVSEAFLSDVIRGKKDISKGLAMGLEYAFGVPSSFWLNLQANYDAELLYLRERDSIQEEERAVLSSIREVVGYLNKNSVLPKDLSSEETIIELRKIFRVSCLTALQELIPSGAFRMSEKAAINPDVLGAWLCLCKVQGEERKVCTAFRKDQVHELVSKLRGVMLNDQGDLQGSLKSLFAEYGIDFSILHNFRGAPVQGYIEKKEDETYRMVLTLRGAAADIFWFSLFHELGHIVNGDVSKTGNFIDAQHAKDEQKEGAADAFASNALLDPNGYDRFVTGGRYSYDSIKSFAQEQGVPPYVVIGRLQKEEIIPWKRFQQYKLRYKWAES